MTGSKTVGVRAYTLESVRWVSPRCGCSFSGIPLPPSGQRGVAVAGTRSDPSFQGGKRNDHQKSTREHPHTHRERGQFTLRRHRCERERFLISILCAPYPPSLSPPGPASPATAIRSINTRVVGKSDIHSPTIVFRCVRVCACVCECVYTAFICLIDFSPAPRRFALRRRLSSSRTVAVAVVHRAIVFCAPQVLMRQRARARACASCFAIVRAVQTQHGH